MPDGCTRGVEFLFANQGARTDTISASCAIGNVSDCFIGLRGANTDKLEAIGLSIECMKISAKNRFNRKTCIGTWWLKIADSELWEKAQAAALTQLQECANDSNYNAKGE